jgi:hypothetical protein
MPVLTDVIPLLFCLDLAIYGKMIVIERGGHIFRMESLERSQENFVDYQYGKGSHF